MEPLESWICPSTSYPSSSNTNTAEPPPSPPPEACRSVGTRLGNILASVHCDASLLSKSQTVTDDGNLWFENPGTKDLLQNEIVGRILPILRPHFDPDTGRPEEIAKIISQDFETSFLDTLYSSSASSPSESGVPKFMFSMGDLWTGSILVGFPPITPSSNPILGHTDVELGLIDWEFAAPGRIGQDIAQLSAWLYLYSTSSAWSSTEPRYRRAVMDTIAVSPPPGIGLGQFGPDFGTGAGDNSLGAEGGTKHVTGEMPGQRSIAGNILNALLESYAHKVKEYPTYAWFVDENHDHRSRFRKDRLAVIRSIWILFGREIIYNAIEAESKFSKFFPVGVVNGDEREKEAGIKMWQRVMIEVGSWHVSKAGESSDEEFEVVARKEGVLKGMYTVSGSS